jgi:pyruvate dehydrogenase E1 component beta subunit
MLNLDKARIAHDGIDITVVAYGDGFHAAFEALNLVGDISVELVDLVSLNPIDEETILNSILKTKRLLTVDTTNPAFSVGSEVLARAIRMSVNFLSTPESLSCPSVPCPTSTVLTENYYPTKYNIANAILAQLGRPQIESPLSFVDLHLPPNYLYE